MSSENTIPYVPETTNIIKRRSKGYEFTLSNVSVGIGSLFVLFVILCAAFPGLLAPYSPLAMNTDAILAPPSLSHPFGTDYFGRDVFSLVVYGSRSSFIIGIVSVIVGMLAGGLIGGLAGYIGGITDMVLMRLIDVLMTIPGILLALTISAALGPSLMNTILAVSVASIPSYARVFRSQVMSIKKRPFIDAARSIGTTHGHAFFRHVLPNSFSPMLVMGTIGVGSSILIGSGLSFLGLGMIEDIPDWGALLSQGRGYLTVAWWICTFPGIAITLLVVSVNLIGDALRDRFDPKNGMN